MNLKSVFQKSWQMLWNYKALWLFGMVLAMVGANLVFPSYWWNLRESERWNTDQWTKVTVSKYATIRIPGPDMTIDISQPGGVQVTPPQGMTWREFRAIEQALGEDLSINLWPILIELGIIVGGLILVSIVARYVAETALIRMVDESEQNGKHLKLWTGIRRGFSRPAARLFLLDLAIGVLALVIGAAILAFALAPAIAAIGSGDFLLIVAGIGTTGLLFLAFWLWLGARLALSLVLQPIRRACVLEEQGLGASVRGGLRMTRYHLKDVGLLWLIWLGIRLLWVPVGALVAILLAPLLLVTVLIGVLAGSVVALPVTALASLFVGGLTPWIMGALAGIPVLIVLTVLPLLFLSGLLIICESSTWTMGYRELKALGHSIPAPRISLASAQGAAD